MIFHISLFGIGLFLLVLWTGVFTNAVWFRAMDVDCVGFSLGIIYFFYLFIWFQQLNI